MVLLKKYDKNGFSFFTNGISRKGRELAENPNAAMLFYWPFVNRQIRIEGQVEKLPVEEVENYWESRPLNSRIGGAISVQSSVIPSRKVDLYNFNSKFALFFSIWRTSAPSSIYLSLSKDSKQLRDLKVGKGTH
jgi:pyridoxine/pyridoxamine 5'-phosphate oxidase